MAAEPASPRHSEFQPPRAVRRHWLLFGAGLAIALVPIFPLLLDAHPLQTIDYLSFIAEFYGTNGPEGLRWIAVLYPNNENFIPLPKLVFLLNIWLTDGSNIPLVWLSTALAVALAGLYWLAMPAAVWERRALVFAAALAAGYLVFAPSGASNFVRGFVGVIFFGSILLTAASVYAYTRGRMGLAVSAAVAGSLTHTIGLFAWPALCLAALGLRRPRREIFALAAATAVLFLLYLGIYERPSGHPPLSRDPAAILFTFGATAGGIWTKTLWLAIVCGLAGAAALCALAILGLQRGGRGIVFWAALAVVPLGAIAAIAFSRAPFGAEMGFSSRYSAISGTLWMCLVALALGSAPAGLRRRPGWGLGAAAVLAAGFLGGWRGNQIVLDGYAELNRNSPAAALMLRLRAGQGFQNDPLNRQSYVIFNWLTGGTGRALERAGHYPFGPDYRMTCRNPGDRIDPAVIAGRLDPASGAVSAAWRRPGGLTVWYGWIDPRLSADCLVITDRNNRVVGGAWTGLRAPAAAARLGLPHDSQPGWHGLSPGGTDSQNLRVLVRFEGREAFLAIPGGETACLAGAPFGNLDTAANDGSRGIRGAFDGVRDHGPYGRIANGWVDGTDPSLHCVVIVDRNGRPISTALTGFARMDLDLLFGPEFRYMGWRAPIPPADGAGPYRAFAIDAEGRAWRLP